MPHRQICNKFQQFLHASPSPYHAVENLGNVFKGAGFLRLDENQSWELKPEGKYYLVRSDSTIAAFVIGKENTGSSGIRMVGTHSDSPCLKVKPQPEKQTKGYQQLGIEVYGGALLNPWFDRDLSIAGRVCYVDKVQSLKSTLVNFESPIAVIPSLAIHLDREANVGRTVNPQTDLNPILFQGNEKFSFRELLLQKVRDDGASDAVEVLDFDMSFYDAQEPNVIGLKDDFFAGARLDNLLSSYVGALSLADASHEHTSIFICSDHEEVGSQSDVGAMSTVLDDILARLYPDPEQRQMAVRGSLLLSVDNAHGIHPNYVNKHDDNHGPLLNQGPVLKFDAKQSYATSTHSASFLKQLARQAPELPLQTFVTRADMRCGSTIGPITAAKVGVKTLDLGVPTFAMHSTRELAGVKDIDTLYDLLGRFYACESLITTA
ncbi:MAG: M18 family aminopeptidase [Agarilytica sp.]